MKRRHGLVLALLANLATLLQAHAGEKNDLMDEPVACQLPDDALANRAQTIAKFFESHESLTELEDGYALRFPGDDATVTSLMDFVRFERRCCSFFVLELTFEPHKGPVWLRVRGSQEVKSFVESWLPTAKGDGN